MLNALKMRWQEKDTLKFLKVYLAKECLWNPDHELYRTKFNRDKAYYEIASEFRALTGMFLRIPEVKIKIKSLKSTYKQEVQKIIQKSKPNSIYKPSLVWFDDMDRCLKYVPSGRPAAADLEQEMQELDSDQAGSLSQDRTSNIAEESPEPLPELYLSDHEYDTITTHDSVVQIKKGMYTSLEHSKSHLRRKKKKLKKHQYFIQSQIENWTKEDEFDIYGKYIASQLRKLELQRALNVQLKIQNLINEARSSSSED